MTHNQKLEKTYKNWIIVLSVVIPIVVAALFGINLKKMGVDVEPLSFLPPIYAAINGLTAVLLFLAVYFIKKGDRKQHERLVKFAMACSVAFLGMYVAYHMTSESTPYGGEGFIRYIYFFILITHIILSVVIIPIVLFAYMRGMLADYEKHKKIAKIAYPLWMYVAISGVVVYLMISPYYAH